MFASSWSLLKKFHISASSSINRLFGDFHFARIYYVTRVKNIQKKKNLQRARCLTVRKDDPSERFFFHVYRIVPQYPPRKASTLVFATFVICRSLPFLALFPALLYSWKLFSRSFSAENSFFSSPKTPEQMHPTRVVFSLRRNASISRCRGSVRLRRNRGSLLGSFLVAVL